MGRKLTTEQVELLDNMCYGANEVGLGTIIKELQTGGTGTGGGVGSSLDAEGAEIFNDYEHNNTNVEYAHIEGYQNGGILKAFHPQGYVEASGTVAKLVLDSVEGIAVGMHYNLFRVANDTIERYRGVITEIEPNGAVVTLEGQSIATGVNGIDSPITTTTVYNNLIVAGGTIGTFEITGFEPDSYEHGFSQHIEGSKSIAGINAHAEGIGTEALGFGSHAEGYYTKAYGERAHAEGYKTLADGNESHAEGLSCQATGEASHAEGSKSVASGDYAHAEGGGSIAIGNRSHAEGQATEAIGNYSHSEGYYTKAEATANYSHVEGRGTVANVECQHVEGIFNKYLDDNGQPLDYLHVVGNGWGEGNRRNAHTLDRKGNAWFAGNVTINSKGHETTLVDNEDLNTQIQTVNNSIDTKVTTAVNNAKVGDKGAAGEAVVFNGTSNNATGPQSFAQGDKCTASGEQSHAEGLQTKAQGNVSHAEGFQTVAEGTVSHAEGWGSNTKASYSHAEGRGTVANVMYQHVEGTFNEYLDADGKALNYVHVVGNGSTAKRSNAYTLDWQGNAWFAGNVTVGENNERLITENELYKMLNGETREVKPGELQQGDVIVDFKAICYDNTGVINPGDEKELIITKDSAIRYDILFGDDSYGNGAKWITLPYVVRDKVFVTANVTYIDPGNPNSATLLTNVDVSFVVYNNTDKLVTESYVNEAVNGIDDRNLTNVTEEGLINITSKSFGETDDTTVVKVGGLIKKGQEIIDFKAYFSDGTIGTKDDEYGGTNEIVLSYDGSDLGAFSIGRKLPYTCEQDVYLIGAWFVHPNNGEQASLHDGNVEIIVTKLNKIATESYVNEQVKPVISKTEELDNNIKQLNTVTNNGLARIGNKKFDLICRTTHEIIHAGDTIVDFDGDKNSSFEMYLTSLSMSEHEVVTTLPYTVTKDCELEVIFMYADGVTPDGGYNASGTSDTLYIKQQPETIECSLSELQIGDVVVDYVGTCTDTETGEVSRITKENSVISNILVKDPWTGEYDGVNSLPITISQSRTIDSIEIVATETEQYSIHTYIVQRPFSNKLLTTNDMKEMEAKIRDLTKRIELLESLIQNS